MNKFFTFFFIFTMIFSFGIITQIFCPFWLNRSRQNLKLAECQPISGWPVVFRVSEMCSYTKFCSSVLKVNN